MNELALSTIELFAGVGMLGEGLRAGLEYLGVPHRTVCYVEREAHAASVLVARMEEGSLDAAPIWSDVTTFPSEQFRGKVDFVVAGFPCQDMSVAGRREGLDGARSGLFFNTVDIAEASGAWGMLLENVAGIFSANASVMDETDGFFFERACARVVGELSDRGWNAEWLSISASDVGASHGRLRWFCLAWREVANSEHDAECAEQRTESREWANKGPTQEPEYRIDGRELGYARLQHVDVQQRENGPEHSRTSDALDYADSHRAQRARGTELSPDAGCEAVEHAKSIRDGSGSVPIGDESAQPVIIGGSPSLGNTESNGRNQGRAQSSGQQGRSDVAEHGCAVADANGIRRREESDGELESIRFDWSRLPIFAPGPSSPKWEWIIRTSPWLAPALEPTFRSVVNGLAFDMGDSRAARLKCVGNGVVPLDAAIALVVLARRAGLA